MGGRTFKNLERLTREQHAGIIKALQASAPTFNLEPWVPLALATKTSFGDVDFIVQGTSSYLHDATFLKWLNSVFNVIGAEHRNGSSNFHYLCTSVSPDLPKQFQVDIITSPAPAFTTFYYTAGYLGQLVERIARNLGLKLTHTGLYYEYMDSSGQKHRLLVTDSFDKVLPILGFSSSQYYFPDETSLVNYIAQSEYFDPRLYEVTKRVGSEVWDSWCERLMSLSSKLNISPPKGLDFLQALYETNKTSVNFKVQFETEIQLIEHELDEKRRIKESTRKFYNTSLVRMWTGLNNGPKLGLFLNYVTTKTPSLAGCTIDELCENSSSEFVEATVRELWRRFQQEDLNVATNMG